MVTIASPLRTLMESPRNQLSASGARRSVQEVRMPLNMDHPTVEAEKNPPALRTLGEGLCAFYAVPLNHYGIKGDSAHLCGYHRSYNTITQVPGTCGWEDYSIQDPKDNTNIDRNNCSALDFNPNSSSSMTVITRRLYNAALARDPRLQAVRRVAGTLDGNTVFSFNCADGKPSGNFDSSHLWHLHLEFWRSLVTMDHTGIYQIMTGEENDMTPEQQQQLTNIHDWLFDTSRGLVQADPGTPHIAVYKPNEWLTTILAEVQKLVNNPPGVPTDEQMEAMAERVAEILKPDMQEAAEAAVRKVLGTLDDATPQP